MRVLHFATTFSALSETFIYDFVTELERQGLDNHVVTSVRQNAAQRPFDKVSVVPAPHRLNPLRLWHRALSVVGIGTGTEAASRLFRRRLEPVVQAIRPDIIHAQFGPAGVLIAPVARRLGVPLVVTFHGVDIAVLGRRKLWRELYARELIDSRTAVVGVSNHVCGKLRELGFAEGDVHLLHNGVQVDKFPYSDPAARCDGRTVKCLHVGRLIEKKNPVLLVRAFGHALGLVGADVDLRLDIIGEGPLEEAVRSEVARLRLTDKVRLLGPLPHDRVAAAMQAAHLYTQHSVTAANGNEEGHPLALIEAASCGLPVVSTRHNGIPDVVLDGETGYLVEERDWRGMGERIASLAADPKRWTELGVRARKHVEVHMNLSLQARKAMTLYARIVSQSKPEDVSPRGSVYAVE